MTLSPYIASLRARVGSMRLLLPSVSAHIFDAEGRLLLVHQRDGRTWSTPGGFVEPDEHPADAAVRETWEETGLVVRPDRVLCAYGGPECVVRYPNGDEAQYVITAIECTITGGTLRPDLEETTDACYWSESDAAKLPLARWLRAFLTTVYAGRTGGSLTPATWMPPASSL